MNRSAPQQSDRRQPSHDEPSTIVAPYCLRCGYDLAGSPSMRCSECGKDWSTFDYTLIEFDRARRHATFRVMRAPLFFAVLSLIFGTSAAVVPHASIALFLCSLPVCIALIPLGLVDATNCTTADVRRRLFRDRLPIGEWPAFRSFCLFALIIISQGTLAITAAFVSIFVGFTIGQSVAGAWAFVVAGAQ